MNKPNRTTPISFAGFNDWFEIFRGGKQTDSAGNTRDFTDAELDSIVANHNAQEPAPLVVGHPKTNDPAYGWTAALKRDGNVLMAKAVDVLKEFDDAVKSKTYPNRSVSIAPDGKGGFKLVHIGFLGAAPPAVSGLKRLYNASADQVMEFSMSDISDTQRSMAWGLSSIGSTMRRMRDFMIEKFSLGEADQIIPSDQIDSIQQQADDLLDQASSSASNNFTKQKGAPMKPNTQTQSDEQTFTKAELDAEVQKALAKTTGDLETLRKENRARDFSAATAKVKTIVDKLVADGRLLPADAAGLTEFCTSLVGGDAPVTFEFTAADGKTKSTVNQLDYMLGLLGKVDGKVIQFGKDKTNAPEGDSVEFSQWDGHNVNPEKLALHNKALAYSKEHKVTYLVALDAVNK